MKKKSEKKSAEPKKTPVRRPRNKKAAANLATSPGKVAAPKKTKGGKSVKTPATSPIDENATSPLSKESLAIPAPTKTATPNPPSPATNLKAKPGKRPIRSSTAPRSEVKIPALLLEGDQPPPPSVSGPGSRYALAPQPVRSAALPSSGELPEAYGTGRIFLAARDPHWLYVSWDFTHEQQSRHNALSRDGHLVIRVFARDEKAPAIPDVHVHPESRNWFVHVPYARTAYRAEIGYLDSTATWRSLSAGLGTARDSRVQTPDLPRTSVTPIGNAPPSHPQKPREPLPIEIHEGSDWTVEKTQALARLIHIDSLRRVWMGSMEITELVRRQLQEEIASIAIAEQKRLRIVFGEEAAGLRMDISSPSGGQFPKQRKFWFKINAELIIYGATEPDASVTIADRPIKLRPDGTFSFRFSLPDGRYQLPAIALSSDGEEGREARLEFSRSTKYRGDVQPHPQDSALRPPRPEHLK